MEHTPGPWRIESGLSEYSASIDIYGGDVWVGCAHGSHMAPDQRPAPGFPSDNEGRANARLIAAAPKLLEALEEIAAFQPTRSKETTSKGDRCVRIAQAAIAKIITEGETDESIKSDIER